VHSVSRSIRMSSGASSSSTPDRYQAMMVLVGSDIGKSRVERIREFWPICAHHVSLWVRMRGQIAHARADFAQFSEIPDNRETGWWSELNSNCRATFWTVGKSCKSVKKMELRVEIKEKGSGDKYFITRFSRRDSDRRRVSQPLTQFLRARPMTDRHPVIENVPPSSPVQLRAAIPTDPGQLNRVPLIIL